MCSGEYVLYLDDRDSVLGSENVFGKCVVNNQYEEKPSGLLNLFPLYMGMIWSLNWCFNRPSKLYAFVSYEAVEEKYYTKNYIYIKEVGKHTLCMCVQIFFIISLVPWYMQNALDVFSVIFIRLISIRLISIRNLEAGSGFISR